MKNPIIKSILNELLDLMDIYNDRPLLQAIACLGCVSVDETQTQEIGRAVKSLSELTADYEAEGTRKDRDVRRLIEIRDTLAAMA